MCNGRTSALTDHLMERLDYSLTISGLKVYSGGISALTGHLLERLVFSLVISLKNASWED